MGSHEVAPDPEPDALRALTRAVLRDTHALERIIDAGLIEADVRRFGVEQEMFLADEGWSPAPVSTQVLADLDQRFSVELGLFNMELNLPPLEIGGRLLRDVERELLDAMTLAADAAERHGAHVVLTGIAPTLSPAECTLDYITPLPRYHALNDAIMKMAGGSIRLHLQGTDELNIQHDSAMLEACNTSFQIHLQVGADEFVELYNIAQLLAAPVLAASANSPLLFAKRLWAETRIALFHQSIDTGRAPHLRETNPRVCFGADWVGSVMDLFEENVSRFRAIIAAEIDEDPIEVLEAGGTPKLAALQLHNGTVYRWNRPCYGVTDGRPHLRIECRVLPAGPSIVDQVANAALWLGAMMGVRDAVGDVTRHIEFDEAKANFIAAARRGLRSGLTWLDGRPLSADRLVLDELLPLARSGLRSLGIEEVDADRYLGIIEARVGAGRTGARWLLESAAGMRDQGSRPERLAALTAATHARQRRNRPVHEWELATLEEGHIGEHNFRRVGQCMTTDLFTVHEDDLIDLVAFMMDRNQIRQILVEDAEHRLVGIISYRSLLRLLATGDIQEFGTAVPVKDVMERELVWVTPDTTTLDAIRLMREKRVSCLPVLQDDRLVGIMSERDFLPIAAQLLEERLAPDADGEPEDGSGDR